MKTLIKNCLLNGEIQDLTLNNERIERVAPSQKNQHKTIDAAGKIVLPGMIDLHTHIRDLNQSRKEDWRSASLAAIAGGVTTVYDMPNTNPPADSLKNILLKEDAAKKALVNFGIYAGASAHNLSELEQILEEDKAAGIKVFLSASSSNEIVADERTLTDIFQLAKKYDKPVLTHCELQSVIDKTEQNYAADEYDSVKHHGAIRSPEAAVEAVKLVLRVSAKVKNALMILHVSTADEMKLIRDYKTSADFPLYVEVTPHHLFLNEDCLAAAGNYGKVNPPLRLRKDNEALVEAVLNGTVTTIGSDHAPHCLDEKNRNYRKAPSGFPGLETSLPLLISNYLSNGIINLEKIIELTSYNPARIMKLGSRGKIHEGCFADLVIVNPNKSRIIEPENFFTKAKYSPFSGMELKGVIETTFVNGIEYKMEDLHGAGLSEQTN